MTPYDRRPGGVELDALRPGSAGAFHRRIFAATLQQIECARCRKWWVEFREGPFLSRLRIGLTDHCLPSTLRSLINHAVEVGHFYADLSIGTSSKVGEAETKTEQLQARITELEEENTDMQNALTNAADFILDSERKLNELERNNRAAEPQETGLSPIEEPTSIGKRKRDREDENEEVSKQRGMPPKKTRKRKHVG
ncbi:hypothetical protein CC78DRAFT_586292 [Lojkania enalia]|uniref:Uncharacterized protein n=1 Tax=Lojkania enalia TaxID=147567 RepID=A0A9P4JXU2_9PLEO|nr:hypothetical protein CC78DRAFT_586292 [Didymosphaeria enalia]